MFNQCSLEETLEGPLSLRQAEGKQLVLKKISLQPTQQNSQNTEQNEENNECRQSLIEKCRQNSKSLRQQLREQVFERRRNPRTKQCSPKILANRNIRVIKLDKPVRTHKFVIKLGGQDMEYQDMAMYDEQEEDYYVMERRPAQQTNEQLPTVQMPQEGLDLLADPEKDEDKEEDDSEDSNRQDHPDYDYPDQDQFNSSRSSEEIIRDQESLDQDQLYMQYLQRCQLKNKRRKDYDMQIEDPYEDYD